MFKAIFFDAVGTLFYLPEPVGKHYALAARAVGLQLDAQLLDRAFASVWKAMPSRPTTGVPREADNPIINGTLPRSHAAKSRTGVPTVAAARPTPGLKLFATSSPRD